MWRLRVDATPPTMQFLVVNGVSVLLWKTRSFTRVAATRGIYQGSGEGYSKAEVSTHLWLDLTSVI